MTGINHAMSGALIGAFLPLPLAIPVAFLSHFVIDTFPHYGIEEKVKNKSARWRWFMYGDAFFALCIAGSGIYYRKWNMEIAGWVAFSPDLVWIAYYFRQGRNFKLKPKSRFMEFHRRIQNESNRGIIFEIILAAIMLPLLIIELHR